MLVTVRTEVDQRNTCDFSIPTEGLIHSQVNYLIDEEMSSSKDSTSTSICLGKHVCVWTHTVQLQWPKKEQNQEDNILSIHCIIITAHSEASLAPPGSRLLRFSSTVFLQPSSLPPSLIVITDTWCPFPH
ncbi:hypothetical protein DPEC_G00165020 [Dallia pectoralis]|uniref:Uncharacterized protein n=1 Tax=Dallia pectoralis TaxID=75939 RepID=A0ACC2GH66_DALPE|nr:hypothetical protein DPEC_G00165020 [Dallia pectoralis]